MLDKNGKELNVGDNVKIFTYKKAVVVEFDKIHSEEVAIVKDENGNRMVYSEEIKKVQ